MSVLIYTLRHFKAVDDITVAYRSKSECMSSLKREFSLKFHTMSILKRGLSLANLAVSLSADANSASGLCVKLMARFSGPPIFLSGLIKYRTV